MVKLYGATYLQWTDFVLVPLMLFVIYSIAKYVANKKKRNPIYKYYVSGLMMKMFGGILVCLIYIFYYKGGDTLGYFSDSICMANLLMFNPGKFFYIMSVDPNIEQMYKIFDFSTLFPSYLKDIHAFFVVKLISPICFITFHSYLLSTLILGCITFTGNWRLCKVLCDYYPAFHKEIIYAVLFIPSVIFWGSGILKDSITLGALGWYLWGFYFGLIKRRNPISGIIAIAISVYIIYKIKVYILVAILPGSMTWLLTSVLKNLKYKVIKTILMPLFATVGLLIGYNMVSSMNQYLGQYATDQVFKQAAVSQYDLKQAHYGGNSFDIGGFDPTFEGAVGKAYIAIPSGLFRPFIWEAKNPMMLISGIENFLLLYFTIRILLRRKIYGFFTSIFDDPMLIFCFIFSILFAFGVGLATSNFGSLVRYRIPLMPFYIMVLLILNQKNLPTKKAKLPLANKVKFIAK